MREKPTTPAPDPHWTTIDAAGALGVVEAVARSGRSGLLLFVSGDRLVRRGAISDAQRNKAVEMAHAHAPRSSKRAHAGRERADRRGAGTGAVSNLRRKLSDNHTAP